MKKTFLFLTLTTYSGVHAMESNNTQEKVKLPSASAWVWSPQIEKALEIAAQWHDGTYRKGSSPHQPPFMLPNQENPKVPVITHLAGVAMILLRTGWDDETVAAGLLHDTLEDANKAQQNLSKTELEEAIGKNIANIVAEVSEQKTDSSGAKLSWKERKEAYIAHLKETGNFRAVAVSLADKINNIRTMNNTIAAGINPFKASTDREALKAGPAEQIWYFTSVIEASERFDDSRLKPLRETLSQELTRFKMLTQSK
jgi:(p)ppGpp synthase/HD superfamily hydrolase